jgi:TolA-binding protein
MLVVSDYELSKSSQAFSQMLKKQKTHEAYFGLGKNLFYMSDYEGASKNLLHAIKLNMSNGTYMIWLGISYLFHAH